MKCSLLTIPFGLLIISTTVLSEININLNYDKDLIESMGKKYDIRGNINLHCKVTVTEGEKFYVKWEKEDQELKNIEKIKERFTEKYVGNDFAIKINHAIEDDAGTYTCMVFMGKEEVKRANITLFSKYRVKTPDNLNFVEGEILKIHCIVHGKPTPEISWKVGNETYEESSGRVTLERDEERGVDNAILVIKEAVMEDRGTVVCIGKPPGGLNEVSDETMVRIKDKYAALWPFLGICAEVFVLCAIILIYEKKRNKTELEESDTDQSPDQKNTPDNGKDSNLRHRQ